MKTTTLILTILATLFSNTLFAQQLSFKADSVSGSGQVIVPVRVFNFNNIIGIQGSIQFDPNVISYDAVLQFGLPGMSMSGFGITQVSNGILSYIWDDPSLNGVSLANSSVIFAIQFTVIGSAGGSVCFVNTPTTLEVIDVNFNTVNASYSCGIISGQSCNDPSDCIDGDVCTIDDCDTVAGCLHVPADCDDFNACTSDGCDPVAGCAYTPVNCDDGHVCTFDDCDFSSGCYTDPVNCDDGDACTIDDCDPVSGCLYSPDPNCNPQQLLFKADSVSGSGQVIVPVRVFNFNDILAIQGSIQFDANAVSFNSVLQFGLLGMNMNNFGTTQISNGILSYSWDDLSLSGVSVADASVLFAIQFTVIGSAGSAVCFENTPTNLEVTDLNFSTVSASYVCGNVSGQPCNNPSDCDDGDGCTIDDCDPVAGCTNTPLNCDDGDACTFDGCDPLLGCINSVLDCDDADPCTIDGCDAISGCYHVPDTNCVSLCDTLICDDLDPCTTDGCNDLTGCTSTQIVCDDGDACTTNSSCVNGSCIFTPIICDDGNLCTRDTCIGGQCFATYGLPYTPEICMVGVDSATGKNIIIWEKPVTSIIDSYVILKETSQTEIYKIIGTQVYSEFSTFIDQQSTPEQSSNKYKLAFIDICGQSIPGSFYHKTIHLSINQGVGNSWNLNWSHYEGFEFFTYNIYRGTTPANLTLLNSIAGNNNSYTDLNPPLANPIYYQIEVVNPIPCNPSARMGKYSASRSNIANTASVGIAETESSSLKMYPNPFSTSITIEMPGIADRPVEFNLFDITGKKLLTVQNISGDKFILYRNNLAQGIYYAELRGVKNIYNGKIIVY